MIKIKLTKVKGDCVTKWLTAAGLSLDGTLQELVARLSEYNEAKVPLEEHGICDVCHASNSDIRVGECQYCGARDDQPELIARETVTDEGKPPRKRGPKVEQAKPKAPKEKPAKPERVAKPTKPEPATDKPKRKRSDAAAVEAINLAQPDPVVEIVASPVELDEALAKVVALRETAALDHYDLGAALFAIYSRKLYLARRGEDGAPLYRAWNQFVDAEVSISPAYTYRLMFIANEYSREQVQSVGIKKLMYIGRVAREDREQLLSSAPEKSVDEIASEVRRLALPGSKPQTTNNAGKSRDTSKATRARLASQAADAATVIESRGEITVGIALGKKAIPLFKAGTSKRAKTLAQIPSAEETLFNGVVVRYRIESTPAGLELHVERVRVTSESPAPEVDAGDDDESSDDEG
jgi:hypothetical protein